MLKKVSKMLIEENFIKTLDKLDTPSYIYNLDILEYILRKIKQDMKTMKNLKLYYAVKANSNKEILKFLYPYIDGVDVASVYEYICVKDIFIDKEISITGPSFTKDDIDFFYSKGNFFDFNSLSQLEDSIEVISNKNIGIRVNIPYNYKNTEIDSRFGR